MFRKAGVCIAIVSREGSTLPIEVVPSVFLLSFNYASIGNLQIVTEVIEKLKMCVPSKVCIPGH